jgi:hypothetical protein
MALAVAQQLCLLVHSEQLLQLDLVVAVVAITASPVCLDEEQVPVMVQINLVEMDKQLT